MVERRFFARNEEATVLGQQVDALRVELEREKDARHNASVEGWIQATPEAPMEGGAIDALRLLYGQHELVLEELARAKELRKERQTCEKPRPTKPRGNCP